MSSHPTGFRSYDRSRVFPYVQQYEFAGLLFSDVTTFGALLNGLPNLVENLKTVSARFGTLEDINDDMKTHPSKQAHRERDAGVPERVDGPSWPSERSSTA